MRFSFFLSFLGLCIQVNAEAAVANPQDAPIAVISQTKTFYSYVHADGKVETFTKEEKPDVKLNKDKSTTIEEVTKHIGNNDEAAVLYGSALGRTLSKTSNATGKVFKKVIPITKNVPAEKEPGLLEKWVTKGGTLAAGSIAANEISAQYNKHREQFLNTLASPSPIPAETGFEMVKDSPHG